MEFSPNSRFLYLTDGDTLRQIDTWEDDLSDGDVLIDVWNQVPDPFNGSFNVSALGPDCRIYIRMFSSTNSFHVIHNPNEKGLACDFEQQAIQLPYITAAGSFPNFPRYRVDEEEKCDSTIVSIFDQLVYYTRELEIFPNPTRDWLYLDFQKEYPKGQLIIYNEQGTLMMEEKRDGFEIQQSQFSKDVSAWAAGTYFVEYLPAGHERTRVMYVGKMIKL